MVLHGLRLLFTFKSPGIKLIYPIEALRHTDITRFIYTRLAAFSSRKIPAIIHAVFSIYGPCYAEMSKEGEES
jgi:hypothetical protein